MDRVRSTVKLSRALKSSSGIKQEIHFSNIFHSNGIPLLVSPALLRKRNLGQLDLARLVKQNSGWILEVGEVKSSIVGVEVMGRFQFKRLSSSQDFLASLFGYPIKLIQLI